MTPEDYIEKAKGYLERTIRREKKLQERAVTLQQKITQQRKVLSARLALRAMRMKHFELVDAAKMNEVQS